MLPRRLLGVMALLLLGGGAYLYWSGGGPGGSTLMLSAACLRTGLLSAAVWLAWPKLVFLQRAPRWLWGLLAIAAGVLVWRPKLLLLIAPLLVVAAGLMAMARRRP